MRSAVATKLIAFAWAVKRRLAIRSRLTWLGWRLWKYRLGVRPIHNRLEDRKWGGFCGGIKPSPCAHLGAHVTQSMDYAQLSYVFDRNKLPIHGSDVLVDVGCGKGRVINFWLGRGYRNRIVGIELDPAIADATRARLRRFTNVEIVTGDATELTPADGTLFFLFNPFGPDVMRRFIGHLKHRPSVRIIYYYCVHLEVIAGDPFWTVEPLRTGDWKRAVLIRPRAAVAAKRGDEADDAGAGQAANEPLAAQWPASC
jgi:SAM-dependent methyltransferase